MESDLFFPITVPHYPYDNPVGKGVIYTSSLDMSTNKKQAHFLVLKSLNPI